MPEANGAPYPGPSAPQQIETPMARQTSVRRSLRGAGLWYFVVTVVTGGAFAWVPFLHAARRLRTPKARMLAVAYGVADVVMYVLLVATPKDGQGQVVNGPISTVGGLLMLAVMIVGCIQLASLRRMVYLGAPVDEQPQAGPVDPAVQAVLAARSRREEARELAVRDPLLARELHIGRPDLARDYDDGGLVDVNGAPAEVIASVCGIPVEAAAAVVAARERQGGQFSNVDEVFVLAELPVPLWDRVRDRAIALV